MIAHTPPGAAPDRASEPVPVPVPSLDYSATSVRPRWEELPERVREAVQEAAGGRVRSAGAPPGSGFSGGLAAVLDLDDGRRVFAKAGSGVNPHLLAAYGREARVLAALPSGVPAPRLVGHAFLPEGPEKTAWQVVVVDAAPGHIPLPWSERHLSAVHAACLAAVAALTPAPPSLGPLSTLVVDVAQDPVIQNAFRGLADGRLTLTAGQPVWLPTRLTELQALVDSAPDALLGQTACHGDLRADNILLDGDRAVLVDWNWLSVGPAWADFVGLLPLARADGVDAEAWLRRSPLTHDTHPDHIDAWLAVIAGFMLAHADEPLWPGATPALRVHQRRYARTFLDWLGARRGWS